MLIIIDHLEFIVCAGVMLHIVMGDLLKGNGPTNHTLLDYIIQWLVSVSPRDDSVMSAMALPHQNAAVPV